jgi:hypothetical protein
MDENDGAAPAAAPSTGELSINEAVSYLNKPPKSLPPTRSGDREQEPTQRPPEEPRVAREKSTPQGVDDAAADQDQPPGEPDENEAADDDLPPLKPHKALTAAEREVFESLPRLAQEAWNQRERDRDTFYRKGHDEAANAIRTAQERERAAEQKQREIDQWLPQKAAQFNAAFRNEFADIKSWDDLSALQQNDPMRYQRFDLLEKQDKANREEAAQAQWRQQQDQAQRYQAYQQAESTKVEKYLAKEHAKLGSAKDVGEKVRSVMLEHYGMSENELSGWWYNAQPMYLADSRIQQMAIDAYAYRDANAKKAAAETTRKPVPPVQRPGTASNRGESQNVQAKILSDRLTKTGKLDDAVALLNARSARRR